MKRIHLISGPRNISTALMYSFGNRPDTTIVDEPMYAYYLHTHPHINHPGKEETLESQSTNLDEVKKEVFYKDYPTSYVFFKNMAHHLDKVDWTFLLDFEIIFLIRNPKQLIASFAQVIHQPTMLDIGLKLEYEIMEYLKSQEKRNIVLDSNEVLNNPHKVLEALCKEIDIPFDDSMLSWPAGPRAEDGVWAKYWYQNVHQSTGFQKQKTSSRPFPEHLEPLLEKAQYYYDKLKYHSIKA